MGRCDLNLKKTECFAFNAKHSGGRGTIKEPHPSEALQDKATPQQRGTIDTPQTGAVRLEKGEIRMRSSEATMSVGEAAKLLGLHPVTVRYLLREGKVDWGLCISKPGGQRAQFVIYRAKLEQEMGLRGGADDGRRE